MLCPRVTGTFTIMNCYSKIKYVLIMSEAKERPGGILKPHLSYSGGNSINDFKSSFMQHALSIF